MLTIRLMQGKTDVAMLTVLRVLGQHRNTTASSVSASIDRNAFKIIYVSVLHPCKLCRN
jgi:hypothetical protein